MPVKFDVNKHKVYSDISIIEYALKKNRNTKAIVGIICIILGVSFILTTLSTLPSKAAFIIALFCMSISFIGFYFLLSALLQYDTQKNYLLKLIIKCPEEVVWIYIEHVTTLPFGIKALQWSTLRMHLSNREQIILQMPPEKAELLEFLLKERLPHANFGYAQYKKQLYDISPNLLIDLK